MDVKDIQGLSDIELRNWMVVLRKENKILYAKIKSFEEEQERRSERDIKLVKDSQGQTTLSDLKGE